MRSELIEHDIFEEMNRQLTFSFNKNKISQFLRVMTKWRLIDWLEFALTYHKEEEEEVNFLSSLTS